MIQENEIPFLLEELSVTTIRPVTQEHDRNILTQYTNGTVYSAHRWFLPRAPLCGPRTHAASTLNSHPKCDGNEISIFFLFIFS